MRSRWLWEKGEQHRGDAHLDGAHMKKASDERIMRAECTRRYGSH
jgi:hypothetical protein